MEYRASLQTAQCGFCGGMVKLEEFVDPQEQIETRLAFAVSRAQALEIYRQWISRQGFFRPFNLAAASTLESLQALWWAAWVVNAGVRATWTADSDAGAQKAKWAPHAGELQSEFNSLVIPATRGLTANECARLIPTYDLAMTALDGDGERDAAMERFDMPRSFARAAIVGAIHRLIESRITNGEIPGSRFRNLHASVQLRKLMTRRMAFPAYVIAYRYRGRLYRTVISGQDPNCVVGEAPKSIGKLLLLVTLALLTLSGFLWFLRFAR
ncbi:MAG TPA: zinc ribbon domain-containing protein [Verrucomicrobiae bacterium]|jgi:hypothetical protein